MESSLEAWPVGEKGVRLRDLNWPFLRLFFDRGDGKFLERPRSLELSVQQVIKGLSPLRCLSLAQLS